MESLFKKAKGISMSKYCHTCLGEFKNSLTNCPNDHALLSDKKPVSFEKLVDLYAASNEIEAERIVTFLRDKGLMARISRPGISQMPVVSDTHYLVSVLSDDVKAARDLIERAIEDGVLLSGGFFL